MAEAANHEEKAKKESKYGEYLKKTEIRIVLVGKTGNGKSATANTLLGKKAFKSSSFAQSETKHCQFEKVQRFEKTFLILDTPGFLDTCTDLSEHKAEIERVVPICSPGVHVFLITLPLTRYTDEEIKAIESIIQAFGKELFQYSIVVFTHKDQFDVDDQSEEGFIKSMTDPLRNLLKCCGDRYIFVDNSSKIGTADRENESSKLLEYILDFVKKNEYQYYSNAMFTTVEDKFFSFIENLLLFMCLSDIAASLEAVNKERDKERRKAAEESICLIL